MSCRGLLKGQESFKQSKCDLESKKFFSAEIAESRFDQKIFPFQNFRCKNRLIHTTLFPQSGIKPFTYGLTLIFCLFQKQPISCELFLP
jgi:hypothetical protein